MKLQKALCLTGVALVVAGVHPAQAQKDGIERALAGIRINSSAKTVLSVFKNPNDIQIGDVAVRPPTPASGGQQTGGMAGGMGGMMGGGMMSGMGGMMGGGGGGATPGGPGKGGGGMMSGMGAGMPGGMMGGGGMAGPPSGMMAGMGRGMMGGGGGMGGGGMTGPTGMPGGMMAGMGRGMMGGGGGGKAGGGGDDGPPGMGGMPGSMMAGGMGGPNGGMGGGSGIGAFGQTTSSSTFQQEVTWSYSLKALDAKKQKQAIGYDFLISPEGKVSQIRITGYVPRTKADRSSKGITLGSTYLDLVRTYGPPKSVMKSGELLVCSYPNKHIEFQLMNMKYVNGTPDPYNGIFKVVAIQINATE